MKNAYNVYGFTDKGFDFNWLGAPVSFVLFGERRTGEVEVADRIYKTLTVLADDTGTKDVTVTAPYQAFRKEKVE